MHQPVKPLPKIWLMTDERNDAMMGRAIKRLPRRSGIVFRHYHLQETDRRKRFSELKRQARKHQHLLLLADNPALARKWGADGVHGRQWKRRETNEMLHSAPVHSMGEIRQARLNGASLFFLSPIFVTHSHPEARPPNILQLRRLADACEGPILLLGGMDMKRFRTMAHLNTHGWAAIDALS